MTGFDDTVIHPGPKPVAPGIIVTGHEGDTGPREEWAKDGSFLAFRYLFQAVPEFNAFLAKNPIPKDGNGNVLTPSEGSELLGARMVGRWKSGALYSLVIFLLSRGGLMARRYRCADRHHTVQGRSCPRHRSHEVRNKRPLRRFTFDR